MPFVNRREELAFPRERSGGERFEFVPIYGRRRVGKTRLVQEFLREASGLYFMADTVAEHEQLRSIGREIGERFGDTILVESGFKDWPQLFRYLQERVRSRFVLAIDEFPYLVSANRAMSSIFQKGIDTILVHTPLFLVLTGSSMGMMEREVLWSGAPLYGRRTGSLEVREMGFCSLREFFPKARFPARAAIYATAGTMPAYVERFDPERPTSARAIQTLAKAEMLPYADAVEYLTFVRLGRIDRQPSLVWSYLVWSCVDPRVADQERPGGALNEAVRPEADQGDRIGSQASPDGDDPLQDVPAHREVLEAQCRAQQILPGRASIGSRGGGPGGAAGFFRIAAVHT